MSANFKNYRQLNPQVRGKNSFHLFQNSSTNELIALTTHCNNTLEIRWAQG